MTFEELNLNRSLLNALDDLELKIPTTIQHKVFPVAMSGRDLVGIAQTGTGKTFAYLLPCLRQYQFSKQGYPTIAILVPTRELVKQVVEEVKKLCAYMSVRVVGAYGGTNIKTQLAQVIEGTDVIVGTPGRFLDLALTGTLKLKSVKKLIIDEVDEMLDLGFRPQLMRIMEFLPEKRQNLMFSATLTDHVDQLINSYFTNPAKIEAAPAGTPVEKIDQSAYELSNFYSKRNLLDLMLSTDKSMTKVLIFTASKRLADILFEAISPKYPEQIGVIHSNKSQNHRFNTIEQFQSGAYRAIIATDIISRGMDISGVSHVINFDLPDEPEHYVHRIGRTGRADARGKAISFITENETDQRAAIENLIKAGIPVADLPEELEITNELAFHELPKNDIDFVPVKAPKLESSGPAYHEKKEKNKKVNKTRTERIKDRQKPRTKGGKRKRK
ncbi:MAG: DEAD/DEAH box helicase [Cyclobacteriaceae bacterium]